ncbi:MAG: hypothetical protein JWO13_808 [Acidobacteriales bacterium]|nr:hypothetical protein [Terriglobales bacterium]
MKHIRVWIVSAMWVAGAGIAMAVSHKEGSTHSWDAFIGLWIGIMCCAISNAILDAK